MNMTKARGGMGSHARNNIFETFAKWGPLVGAVAIVAVNLVYSSLYFSNTFPLSEGWFVNYVELVLHGKVPYRDFFYYLPPFTLALDTIFWKLSFGLLIVFRGWYLAERILIFLLVYRLLCRFFNWKYASLACVISEILCTADDFDFFGDYNQNIVLLAVLLAFSAVKFVEAEKANEKYKHLFAAGVVMGFMFLCKQTIILAAFIIYFAALIVHCILNKDKKFLRYVVSVAIGAMLPIAVFAIYLVCTGALMPFIDQVFLSVSGKGSILDIIYFTPAKTFKHVLDWAIAALMLSVTIVGQERAVGDKIKKFQNWIPVIAIVLIASDQFNFSNAADAAIDSKKYVLLLVVAAVPWIVLQFIKRKREIPSVYFSIAGVFWCVCFLFGSIFSKITIYSFYESKLFYSGESFYNIVLFYFAFCFIVYCIIKKLNGDSQGTRYEALAMVACAGLALCYASSMAFGAETMPSNAMRITMPLMLCFLLSECTTNIAAKTLRVCVCVVSAILVASCCAQKIICAYPWWGITNEPMWDKTYTVDIPEMRGLTFSEEDQNLYETVTQLINDNSDEDAIIFGYPYIKIFNVLCHRYNSNFVPVIWYDVVGDKYVDITLQEVQEKLPEIVLWKEIPGAIQAHEDIYRAGYPLEQRKLEAFFNEKLPEEYELLDEVEGIKVYKLKE